MNEKLNKNLNDILICPRCKSSKLEYPETKISCKSCNSIYNIKESIPFLIDPRTLDEKDQIIDYDYFFAMLKGKITERLFYKTKTKFILKYLNSGKKVLDIGCDGGTLLIPLLQREMEVTGLDLSFIALKKCLQNCKKHIHKKELNLNLIYSDAKNIPLRDNYFDIVLLSDVLRHINRKEDVAKEAERVCKNNGFIIVSNHTKNLGFLKRFLTGRSLQDIQSRIDFKVNESLIKKIFLDSKIIDRKNLLGYWGLIILKCVKT